jgi:predicted transcriptional regulator
MTTMKATIVRLSTVQRAQLSKLAKKFQVNQSNVIRLAIARMAEQEGITSSDKR